MSPGDVIRVSPDAIRFKLSNDLDLGGIKGGDWDIARRVPIEQTDKHVSVFQRYAQGFPWQDTVLFRGRYAAQLAAGERVRGAADLDGIAAAYERQVDTVFVDIKVNGFLESVVLPKVHIGRDGEVLLGNNGNHRVAMAKVLGLSEIPVRIHTRHERCGA